MTTPKIRKIQLCTERVSSAGGKDLDVVLHKGSIAAVVENPFVGTFPSEETLAEWMSALSPAANEMAEELRDALLADGQSEGRQIETYGKGAIVGANGDMEIAAAWHVPGGASLRHALDSPKAMVPASKKVGHVGAVVDIPLVYIHASYLRTHYDVCAVSVADGPRPNEVVYAVVMSTGPRPHGRIGGFTKDEVSGEDGLR